MQKKKKKSNILLMNQSSEKGTKALLAQCFNSANETSFGQL